MNTPILSWPFFFVSTACLVIGAAGCGSASDDSGNSATPPRSALSDLAPMGGAGIETPITLGGKPEGVRYCRRADVAPVCSDDEVRALIEFQSTVCSAEFDEVFGPNHVAGDFAGGACEAYVSCYNACSCDDQGCRTACPGPDSTCTTALTHLFGCTVNSAHRADSPTCKGP